MFSNKLYRNKDMGSNDNFITIRLRVDPVKKVYLNLVINIQNVLGRIGGLQSLIFVIISSSLQLIFDRRFTAAFIRDMYKVQKYTRDHSEYYKSKKSI